MKCFRCGKDIDRPGLQSEVDAQGKITSKVTYNADYIIADDTKGEDIRQVFIAYRENTITIEKASKGQPIADKDYDQSEITSPVEAVGAVMVKPETVTKTVQKTGVICPACYKPTDFVIWGAHK